MASIDGRVSFAAVGLEDDAPPWRAMECSTRSSVVWKARVQSPTVQLYDAMLVHQVRRQIGMRAGEYVSGAMVMGADLAVGPCRVWLARPPRVEHLP